MHIIAFWISQKILKQGDFSTIKHHFIFYSKQGTVVTKGSFLFKWHILTINLPHREGVRLTTDYNSPTEPWFKHFLYPIQRAIHTYQIGYDTRTRKREEQTRLLHGRLWSTAEPDCGWGVWASSLGEVKEDKNDQSIMLKKKNLLFSYYELPISMWKMCEGEGGLKWD